VLLARAATILAGPMPATWDAADPDPNDLDPNAIRDYTTDVLGDYRSIDLRDPNVLYTSSPYFIYSTIAPNAYFDPFEVAPGVVINPVLDTNPTTINEVERLWRYMAGGVVDMELAFYDGLNASGSALGAQEMQWIVCDAGLEENVTRNPGDQAVIGTYTDANGVERDYVLWSYHHRGAWPKLIRMRLTMRDQLGRAEPQTVDLILSVPPGG
jgi:hypothetical protein